MIEAAGTVLLPEDLAALLTAMRSTTAPAVTSQAEPPPSPEVNGVTVTDGQGGSACAQSHVTNEVAPRTRKSVSPCSMAGRSWFGKRRLRPDSRRGLRRR